MEMRFIFMIFFFYILRIDQFLCNTRLFAAIATSLSSLCLHSTASIINYHEGVGR